MILLAASLLVLSAAPVATVSSSAAITWTHANASLLREGFAEDDSYSTTTLLVGGESIRVLVGERESGVSRDEIARWVERSANDVAAYFGRNFPVRRLIVRVITGGRGGLGHGVTFEGTRIRVDVGKAAMQSDLDEDWVMVHEMFHLGFPDLDGEKLWMQEGLSTYLEPLARARGGHFPESDVWADLVKGLPNGMPDPGDAGFDRTHSWGNTYWGGCRFWLLADLGIREKTGNAKSLDDAIRAIRAAGGNGSEHWDVSRLLKIGDTATGTTVLSDLHAQMSAKPLATDLDALWKKLGVEKKGGAISFRDDAPLSKIRRSMTARAR